MWFSKKRGIKLEKENKKLRADVDSLNNILKNQEVSNIREIDNLRREFNNQHLILSKEISLIRRDNEVAFMNMKNEVEKLFIEFELKIIHQIADRYFSTLESIFRWNREFSFLDKHLQGDKSTLDSLRKTIIQPLLDRKNELIDQAKGNKLDNFIKTKGAYIVQRRKELHDEKLKLEREEKDAKIVTAKLEVIDFFLKEATK